MGTEKWRKREGGRGEEKGERPVIYLLAMCRSPDEWIFLRNWKERLPYMDSDFQFVEPVLALRASVLHGLMCRSVAEVGREAGREAGSSLGARRKVEQLFGLLTETLFTQAKLAREAARYQVSRAERD